MKEKIKVLIVPSDTMGVGHFRSIWPAQSMEKYHSDDFEVEINSTPRVENIEYMSQFDIIHFHRHLGAYETSAEAWGKLKEAGYPQVGLRYTWYYSTNSGELLNSSEENLQLDKYPDRIVVPQLEDVIEELGDEFENLHHQREIYL